MNRELAKRARVTRSSKWRRDGVVLFFMLIVASLVILRLVGFPAPVRRAALRRLNADRHYLLDVRAIRFRFPFGVYLDQPRLFRRGTIGPPIIEASRVAIRFAPDQWRHRRSGVRFMRVDGGIIRRPMPSEEHPGEVAGWKLPDGDKGLIEFRDLNVTGLQLKSGSARYRVEGPWLWMDEGQIVVAPDETAGMITGHGGVHLPERRYLVQVQGNLDPRRLIPMVQVWKWKADHLLSALEFGQILPEAQFRFNGRLGTPEYTVQGSGRVEGTGFQFRGVPLAACMLEGNIDYDGHKTVLDIRQATGIIDDGLITGQAFFDMQAGVMTIDVAGNSSPLPPVTLAGLTIPGLLQTMEFNGVSRWHAKGRIAYRDDRDQTDLRMDFAGEQITYQRYLIDTIKLVAQYDGHTLDFTDVHAGMFNGKVTGAVAAEPHAENAPPFRFDLEFDRLDFGRLIAAISEIRNPESYEGHLSAVVRGHGLAVDDWLAALTADGRVRIREGRLFRLPLFGGLSQILSRVIPGMDVVLMQTSARADFSISEKQLQVRDGRIEGEVFNVEGQGLYILDSGLDFQVQLKLMKDQTLVGTAIRAITYPISKLFEFRLRGTLERPRWYPVNFSGDLLERLRGILD